MPGTASSYRKQGFKPPSENQPVAQTLRAGSAALRSGAVQPWRAAEAKSSRSRMYHFPSTSSALAHAEVKTASPAQRGGSYLH